MIASHLQLFEELNIVPDVLEAPSMAMANFLYFNLSQVEGKEGIAIINLGAKASSLNIIEGQTLRFNLDFPWAGDDLTLAIAQKLNLDCDNRSDVSSDLNVDIVQKTDANFDKADEIKRTLDFGGLINDPNGHSEQSEESQRLLRRSLH